ncbi:hypothetical protein ACFE04_011475 [Oxalis oulophora]
MKEEIEMKEESRYRRKYRNFYYITMIAESRYSSEAESGKRRKTKGSGRGLNEPSPSSRQQQTEEDDQDLTCGSCWNKVLHPRGTYRQRKENSPLIGEIGERKDPLKAPGRRRSLRYRNNIATQLLRVLRKPYCPKGMLQERRILVSVVGVPEGKRQKCGSRCRRIIDIRRVAGTSNVLAGVVGLVGLEPTISPL